MVPEGNSINSPGFTSEDLSKDGTQEKASPPSQRRHGSNGSNSGGGAAEMPFELDSSAWLSNATRPVGLIAKSKSQLSSSGGGGASHAGANADKRIEFMNVIGKHHHLRNLFMDNSSCGGEQPPSSLAMTSASASTIPLGEDFDPKYLTRVAIYCLSLWSRRSLALVWMRMRQFSTSVRRILRWMKRWVRKRNGERWLVFVHWQRYEERERKAMQEKLYELGKDRETKGEMKANVETYAKLHTTDDQKLETVDVLYKERRAAFLTEFHRWYQATTQLGRTLHNYEVQSQKHPLDDRLIRLVRTTKKQHTKALKHQPKFAFNIPSVAVQDLISLLFRSMPLPMSPNDLAAQVGLTTVASSSPRSPKRSALSPSPSAVSMAPLALLGGSATVIVTSSRNPNQLAASVDDARASTTPTTTLARNRPAPLSEVSRFSSDSLLNNNHCEAVVGNGGSSGALDEFSFAQKAPSSPPVSRDGIANSLSSSSFLSISFSPTSSQAMRGPRNYAGVTATTFCSRQRGHSQMQLQASPSQSHLPVGPQSPSNSSRNTAVGSPVLPELSDLARRSGACLSPPPSRGQTSLRPSSSRSAMMNECSGGAVSSSYTSSSSASPSPSSTSQIPALPQTSLPSPSLRANATAATRPTSKMASLRPRPSESPPPPPPPPAPQNQSAKSPVSWRQTDVATGESNLPPTLVSGSTSPSVPVHPRLVVGRGGGSHHHHHLISSLSASVLENQTTHDEGDADETQQHQTTQGPMMMIPPSPAPVLMSSSGKLKPPTTADNPFSSTTVSANAVSLLRRSVSSSSSFGPAAPSSASPSPSPTLGSPVPPTSSSSTSSTNKSAVTRSVPRRSVNHPTQFISSPASTFTVSSSSTAEIFRSPLW